MRALRLALTVLVVAAPFAHGHATAATTVTAALSGASEVPAGSGDVDGTGSATIKLKTKKRSVCWQLTFANIDTPNAGHIHEGSLDVDGPIIVTLFSSPLSDPSRAEGCVRAPRSVIRRIAANPSAFYVNLHNAPFPDGAIRGQLY